MTHADFKKLVADRLRIVELLMANAEWWMAAYMLGFVLECVLKAGACKALNLQMYPASQTTKREISSYFATHDFDKLLIVSGASDIFAISSEGGAAWSGFTQEYQGPFTNIRYDVASQYNEAKVKKIYDFLTRKSDGIISLMTSKNKW